MDGDSIRIHYIGRLANGRAFDDSYERNQPLPFVVGKRQVIDGLDKGIRNFHRGDKGILIIPSRSAYGDKEVGKIPPNSVLVFEVEILME
jgi:peptidylprolyl isomerase